MKYEDGESPCLLLSCKHIELKFEFLKGYAVAMVTCYVKK